MPDWTNVLKYPPSEIFCHCGAIFHSHAMFDGDTGRMVLKSSCPGCGKSDAFWRISTAPESQRLGPGDISLRA